MEQILQVFGKIPKLQKNKDDSLTDRFNHKYTVGLLVLFAVILSAKQYVGDPINCWVPAHFSNNWEEYTNSYCWIKNTYYLPFQDYIPAEHEADQRSMITYYQWVPLILLVQALVFYLPCMVWRTLNSRAGINIDNIVGTCKTFQLLEEVKNKNKALEQMTRQMNRFVTSQRNYNRSATISIKNCFSRIFCLFCGRRHGNYLVVLYLLVKLLYIANVIGQFFLMNEFLGTRYHEFGINFFQMLAEGDSEEVMDVPAFPRVTMCDFKIRVLGNLQRYTVQCVLTINLFNEMVYLFLWFWMVFLAFTSILSLLSWFTKIIPSTNSTRFIKKHLMLLDRIFPRDDSSFQHGDDYVKVQFTEFSEELQRPLSSSSSDEDCKPDKYAHLKNLLQIKNNGRLSSEVKLNPEKDKDLMNEILNIAPEDARKTFTVYGQPGHDICDGFIKYLHKDGIFVLRIVGNNTNSITITEVTCALWDKYCEFYFNKKC